jgi:hypothetical protein
MRMFAALAAPVAGGGRAVAMYWSSCFSVGEWHTGVTLLVFAGVGAATVRREARDGAAQRRVAADAASPLAPCVRPR